MTVHKLDLGISDVSTPSGGGAPARKRTMASITTKARKALPDSAFALPSQRKYPIGDASHVRNAAARLEQAKKAGTIAPGDYAKAKRAIAAAAKKFGIVSEYNAPTKAGRRLAVRAELGQGGSLHVRHMSSGDPECAVRMTGVSLNTGEEVDPKSAGVTLKGPATYSDGSPKKLVWVNLACAGHFKGHRAGAFELNDTVFKQIKANFDRDGLPVHYDMEHASESDPTDGSIPITGAPAHGWIHRLQVRPGELWGLTEWLDYARTGIKAGNFGFISPAIRFNSRDRVTGENIGARLTSAALCNSPFLTKLAPPIAASDRPGTQDESIPVPMAEEQAVPFVALKAGLAHSPAEYMPSIKACLSLPELATAQECADQVGRLRGHFDAAGGDPAATPDGVPLVNYLRPLRDLVGATPGATWDEVFDIVEDLIDTAMDRHELEYHSDIPEAAPSSESMLDDGGGDDGASMTDHITGGVSATNKDTTMPVDTEVTLKLGAVTAERDAVAVKLSAAEAKLTDVEAKVAELTLSLKDESSKRTAAEEELAALRQDKADREAKDLADRVTLAYETYKDAQKLTEDDKESMLLVLKARPEAFEKKYPKVPAAKQHLLKNLTDSRPAGAPTVVEDGGVGKTIDLVSAARALASQKGIPLGEAQRIVFRSSRTASGR